MTGGDQHGQPLVREILSAPSPTFEATEVMAFAPEDIPWAGIAFKTTMWALHDWLGRRRPDLEPPWIRSGR